MILFVNDNSGILFLSKPTAIIISSKGGGYTEVPLKDLSKELRNRILQEDEELLIIIKNFIQWLR